MRYKNAVLTKNGMALSADVPDGYRFLAWIHIVTDGWVALVYPERIDSQSTYIWTPSTIPDQAKIRCYYICAKV